MPSTFVARRSLGAPKPSNELLRARSLPPLPWQQRPLGLSRLQRWQTEGYVRLTACSLPPRSPRPADPTPTRAELAPFVPAAVLDLTVPAEFREICVVFVIFQEPPTVAALHAFVATVQDKALAYGGLLNQMEFGDKGSLLLLLFGAPVTYENIVERTAQFLLALRHEETGVVWRAGVTYGTVWAGFRGGAERWEYGAVGDVMNLAARLAVKAPWGEIWTSAALHGPLHHHYRMDTVGAIQFKGKQAPTQVYRLLGGAASTPTAPERRADGWAHCGIGATRTIPGADLHWPIRWRHGRLWRGRDG